MLPRCTRFGLAVLGVVVAVRAAPAVEPLYGPRSFETAGPATPNHDTFDVAAATTVLVWIVNGDGEGGSRATGGRVDIAGSQVAGPADFAKASDLIVKPVALAKGETAIDVIVEGGQGATIAVVVMPQASRPDLSVGRLVLPHASGSGLTVVLKNGSRFARQVKVLFLDDAGDIVAWSHRFELPGRGSLAVPFGDLIDEGSFAGGSVEVLWAGRGPGRLFGQATIHDELTGVDSIVEMPQAGWKRLDPADSRR